MALQRQDASSGTQHKALTSLTGLELLDAKRKPSAAVEDLGANESG